MKSLRFLISLIAVILLSLAEINGQQTYSEIPSTGKTSIFSDNFDNNSNSWFLDNLWVKGRIENGQYLLTCKNYQKSTGLSYLKVAVDQSRDYEIETSIKNIKGTGGLIFGVNSKYDHYRVELAGNKIIIAKNTLSSGKIEQLSTSTINPAISFGTFYKISVRKYKGEFFIYLNESLIGRFDIIKPEGDQLGFNVGLNSEIIADYLNVSYIQDKPLLAAAEQKAEAKENEPTAQKPEVNKAARNMTPILTSSADLKITWTSPSGAETTLDNYSGTVKAKIESALGLSKVSFYVNGIWQGDGIIKPRQDLAGVFEVEKLLSFNPGRNSVYIIAANEKDQEKSEDRYFTNPNSSPPEISWVNPVSNKIATTDRITIEACIKSAIGLRSLNLFVNGTSVGEDYVFVNSTTTDCNIRWSKSVPLKNGQNSIYIIAQNNAGNTTSENLMIDYRPGTVEKRIALVIGNAEYKDKQPLKNPVNDALLMAGNLESLGFKVIKTTNASKVEMEKALMEFSQVLPEYNVALFYYAGHGIQVDGRNYLIPIDAKLTSKATCQWETIELSKVVSEFEKFPNNINIVILDACRNDPFTDWVRGNESGFRFITNVSGTIIGYATVEGATAADGTGANGLYTEELIKQMNEPQSIESVFKKTRVQVELRSNGKQSPRESSGLRGEFYFKK